MVNSYAHGGEAIAIENDELDGILGSSIFLFALSIRTRVPEKIRK